MEVARTHSVTSASHMDAENCRQYRSPGASAQPVQFEATTTGKTAPCENDQAKR